MIVTLIIINIIKKDRQCKAERGRLTPYQSKDPSPTLPTYREKEEKGKIVEDRKGDGANQIVPERYWDENKSPAVQRGFAVGRRISIPMCDQSKAGNLDWHISTGRAPQNGCIGLHLILYSIHNTAIDWRWERLQLSTPPAKKQAPLTTRSSSLRCVSAAEHHTAEQYSKTGKTKPKTHLPMSNLSWNTR